MLGRADLFVEPRMYFPLHEVLDDAANSIRRFRRLHCRSLANWHVNCARQAKTMQRRGAIKSAGTLVLSVYRWTKMLVRGQQHALEIVVAVVRAGTHTIGFR